MRMSKYIESSASHRDLFTQYLVFKRFSALVSSAEIEATCLRTPALSLQRGPILGTVDISYSVTEK